MTKHRIALVKEIPPGSNKVVNVRGREICVFNVGGDFFALLKPGCSKLSRPGEILRCPWHGWEFDLKTGKSHCDPERMFTKQYKTCVENEAAEPGRELQAETFPVVVEEATVFVEM